MGHSMPYSLSKCKLRMITSTVLKVDLEQIAILL